MYIDYVCTLELLSISGAFIFMFVHYIDKVELPVKKSYIEKKNRWNEKNNRQIIEE